MNKIKDIRRKSGLSQSKFAKMYDIPVRTLQQWEQGKSDPPVYLVNMIEKQENLLNFKKYTLPKRDSWKVCIDDSFLNCNLIYPIQQSKVKSVLDDICKDNNVKKAIVFGSSVTNHCHIGSDVDIYFEIEKNRPVKIGLKDFEFDSWNNFSADERLKKEILSKGVLVYERN